LPLDLIIAEPRPITLADVGIDKHLADKARGFIETSAIARRETSPSSAETGPFIPAKAIPFRPHPLRPFGLASLVHVSGPTLGYR
jgi:hypothetical protein